MDFSLTDEQQRLVETARKFARDRIIPVAQKLDEHGTFPSEICKEGWELGLMNAEIPTEYGGLGLSCTDHVLMMEEINYGCAGAAVGLLRRSRAQPSHGPMCDSAGLWVEARTRKEALPPGRRAMSRGKPTAPASVI